VVVVQEVERPMTTKRFLLDLLDAEEFRARAGQVEAIKLFGESISALESWKQIKLNDIDKARRLVESCPDEPVR
jgi:hypothetical protein